MLRSKRQRIWAWLAVLSIIAVLCLIPMGCNPETSVTPETPAPQETPVSPETPATPEAPDETVLVVTKGETSKSYTLEDLMAMPVQDGYAGLMSSTGDIIGPLPYKGIAMMELLDAIGSITEDDMVRVEAKDGYAMTFSYEQLTTGGFNTFKVSDGTEVEAGELMVVLAYEEDGLPLGEKAGPLRTIIYSNKDQVTEGHWWIKWVTKIDVVPASMPFTLHLEGTIIEDMDSGSYESCAAPGCHGVEFKDSKGRNWEGIPLYLLVGRVDDDISHKGPAFNDALADAGYQVVLIAGDGYEISFDVAAIKRSNDYIIAYLRDGMTLPDNQWPLRLVGPDLEKAQQIGGIVTIKIVNE